MIQSTIKHELDKTNSKDNNWKTVKLSDIGNIVGGKTPNTEILRYWENGNIEWITPSDMNSNLNNYQLLSSKRKITECALKEKSIKLIEPGSIIMSSRAPIGYLGINKMPTCIGVGCKSLTIKNDKKYLNKYVYFAIYNSLPSIIEKASGVIFKEVSGSQFNEITIDIPTFEEQVKIVDKIEKILKLIDKLMK